MPSVIYYTDFNVDPRLFALCRDKLVQAAGECELVTVGLGRTAGFGDQIWMAGTRGAVTLHKQILTGLEAATGEYAFLTEHDVLYHWTHFDFIPPRADTFYYNTHVWHVRYPDGHAVYYDAQQVSGLCASRALLLEFYRARLAQLERDGNNRHYEPGLHQTVGGQRVENRQSVYPNLDIRHGHNLTPSKWSPADFRNRKHARGWQEATELPGWGKLADLFRNGA